MQRRQFLTLAGALGASSLLPVRLGAADIAARPHSARSIYVDAQGALSGFDKGDDGKFRPSTRLLAAIRERRIDLISATIAPVGNGPNRFVEAVEAIADYDAMIGEHSQHFMKIERVADIRAARDAGKVGLLYNFQDTAPIGSELDRVKLFATLGVKVMQLTYNLRNLAGDGCLEPANAGLSVLGRQTIERINEERVLLDLSHAGQRTIAEGIAASKAPPSITHSGCRALTDLPRNTHDTEMRALAEKGGVFGVYLMPFLLPSGQPKQADLIRHLEHAVNVCGEDHVGIGTDNPLMGYEVNDETRKRHRENQQERERLGIAAPGESPDVLLLVEGYNDVARFDRLALDLTRRGWSQARVDKVLGDNFVRLFGEVWGG